jgi:branched-chain amino acid transport system permease protein
MDFLTLGSQLLIGLSRAMLLFIVASGLTLVFGVLRVINFAHGSFYMIGAFLAYTIALSLGGGPAGFWGALLIAPLAVAFLSLVIERFLLRFIYKREHLMQMLLTYSLVLIFGDAVKMLWGTQYKSIPVPESLSGSFVFLGAALPRYNAFLLLVGPLVAVGLWYLLSRTKVGKICRATATDREMVDALGVDSTRVFAAVFVLGGWLAGLGGALIAPTVSISLGMDVSVIINAFLVVVIGGLGNIWGALVSSLLLGVGEAVGVLIWPQMAIVLPFLITAAVLILKPSGLLKSVW